MKNLIRLAAILLILSFALSGCYYDKENELYPLGSNCDTAGVITYSGSIKPIMVANCNTCHAENSTNGVVTINYDGLSIIAKNGNLWYAVNWEGPSQTRMPQGASDTLSVCDRTKIKKWIDAGSLNN